MPEPAGPDLILASASPRRRELLERLGLVLRVSPVDLDETAAPGELPGALARRLAAAKCDAAYDKSETTASVADVPVVPIIPIIGADTIVVLGGSILGKPRDEADARSMLGRLAGRRHEVMTATCVRRGTARAERLVTTAVTFRLLDAREVDAYMESGEWQGKAGGYAIQGIAAAFATEIRGSHTNVIGLPLAETLADLRAVGGLERYPAARFGAPP